MTPMRTKLYYLTDPRTGALRYIGKTSKSLRARLSSHLAEARYREASSYRLKWLRCLLAQGLKPSIHELDEVEGDGCPAEISFIGIARALGCKLVNNTDGGDGASGAVVGEETRALMRAAQERLWADEEHRVMMRAARVGRKATAETKAKMSASLAGNTRMLGKSLSEATKELIRQSKLRREPYAPEVFARMRKTKRAQRLFQLLVKSAIHNAA